MDFRFRRAVDVFLFIMGTAFTSLVVKAYIDNWNNGVKAQPIEIRSARLQNMHIVHPGDKLSEVINGTVINDQCDHIYVLSSIVDEHDKVVQLDKVISLNTKDVDHIIIEQTPLTIDLPELANGKYQLRTEIHELCGGKSYVIVVPLVPFEVR